MEEWNRSGGDHGTYKLAFVFKRTRRPEDQMERPTPPHPTPPHIITRGRKENNHDTDLSLAIRLRVRFKFSLIQGASYNPLKKYLKCMFSSFLYLAILVSQ